MPKVLTSSSIGILICLLLLATVSCTKNEGAKTEPAVEGVQENGNRIPYWEAGDSGLMLVEARVMGSKPLRFIFDTGASQTVIFENENTRGIRNLSISGLPARSESGSEIPWKSIHNVEFEIGDQKIEDLTLFAAHWSHFAFFPSSDQVWADGIIGFDLLKTHRIQIDRQSGVLIIHEPNKKLKLENWGEYEMSIEDRKPYITGKIWISKNAIPIEVKLHLDTGMAGYLALILDPALGIVAPTGSQKGVGYINFKNVSGSSGLIPKMEIMNTTFEGVFTSFTSSENLRKGSRNGSIGSLLLRDFDLIVDFPEGRVLAKHRDSETGHNK